VIYFFLNDWRFSSRYVLHSHLSHTGRQDFVLFLSDVFSCTIFAKKKTHFVDRIAFEKHTWKWNHCLIKKKKMEIRTTFLKCFQYDMYMIYHNIMYYYGVMSTFIFVRLFFILQKNYQYFYWNSAEQKKKTVCQ